MKKKAMLWICLCLLLAGGILAVIFREPIIDWLPIDQSGWDLLESGGHCYLDEDGDPISGWQKINSKTYYFDPATCAMHTGWLELPEGRYYLDKNGVRLTGWQEIDGTRYYLGNDGIMHTGWLQLDGTRMYLNEAGIPHTGWLEAEEGTYHLDNAGIPMTGWLESDGKRYYLDENGLLRSGWLQLEDEKFYLSADGTPLTGWQEVDGSLYYLGHDGIMVTGWLEQNGQTYYLKEDGSAARGRLVIEDKAHYFTSTGAEVLLVNRWNPLPMEYEPEVSESVTDCLMEPTAGEAAAIMLADMEAAVGDTGLLNGYRPYGMQHQGFYGKIKNMMAKGHSYSAAFYAVSQVFAYPGTSEHQSGLAIDIMGRADTYYLKGETKTIQWLKEHCWDYGFILRYPEDKSHITGIIYEPWHFRYVGKELALELKELGLCLEEYLDALTNDGTTCGNPDALNE